MSEKLYLRVLLLIIILIAVLAVILILMIRNNRTMRKAEHAAKILLRREILESVIRGDRVAYDRPVMRPMLMVRIFHPSKRYVFDLAKCIYIGRNANLNQIAIQDNYISDRHCRICLRRGKIILEDLNSTNGIYVRHRMKKNKVTKLIELAHADKIYIGTTVLQVYPFYVNITSV